MVKNRKKVIIGITILIILILSVTIYLKHINTTTYKLKKMGYNNDEIKTIIEKNIDLNIVLKEYNPNIIKIVTSKYYIESRLDRYRVYYNSNKDKDVNEVISLVNANRDKDFYTDIIEVNEINNLSLVNKYYQATPTSGPNDLKNVSTMYAYSGHTLKEEANELYVKMATAAKNASLKLIVTSSYRSFESQETTYSNFLKLYGKTKADDTCARAGHSDHQTGLAVDITTSLGEEQTFEDTDEFSWLIENAHKYGFILRYPKDKENITGYMYEPWHFRYVGIDVATYIKENNITFDEYYAYFVLNK